MVKMIVDYQGEKHCEVLHESSGVKLQTDAPKDNQGRGESFSPTDLMAAALASCALTTMALQTEKEGFYLAGSHATVVKTMTAAPRRIDALTLVIHLPKSLNEEQRARLEKIAHECPAHRSLHPDVKLPMEFHYSV